MKKGTVLARSLATHSSPQAGVPTHHFSAFSLCVSLSLPIHLHTLFAKLVTHCTVIMMK